MLVKGVTTILHSILLLNDLNFTTLGFIQWNMPLTKPQLILRRLFKHGWSANIDRHVDNTYGWRLWLFDAKQREKNKPKICDECTFGWCSFIGILLVPCRVWIIRVFSQKLTVLYRGRNTLHHRYVLYKSVPHLIITRQTYIAKSLRICITSMSHVHLKKETSNDEQTMHSISRRCNCADMTKDLEWAIYFTSLSVLNNITFLHRGSMTTTYDCFVIVL